MYNVFVVKNLGGGFIMKKILFLIIFFLGFAFVGQITANAKSNNYTKAVYIAEKANREIDFEIHKAILKEEMIRDHPNYEAKLDIIIEVLIKKTERISAKAQMRIERLGFEAECEYKLVIIGGREVYVDPLRVHRW